MNKYLLVAFVLLGIFLVVLISRRGRREGMESSDTLVRISKLEESDKQVENRLALVEKELKTAKEEQSKGEAQVNAGIGSIQAIT